MLNPDQIKRLRELAKEPLIPFDFDRILLNLAATQLEDQYLENLDEIDRDTYDLIRVHEGLKLRVYPDTKGIMTIGYGHNLQDKGFTKEQSETILKWDVQDFLAELKKYPWFEGLSSARKAVCLDIMFNVGVSGFNGFHRMIYALSKSQWKNAADEIIDSQLATNRAKDLAWIMETDTIFDLGHVNDLS